MSISFQCPRCSKKLKAPDSAAGKSSSCPGCGGTVTCPEPDDDVVEMQLTPEKPKGFDPFADIDDGTPYGVAAPDPSEAADAESRRPCPSCGEMIVATAAKCRFCGEVLGATPALTRAGKPKSGKGKKKAELKSIAQYQRYLLICILIQLLAYIPYVIAAISLQTRQNKESAAGLAIVVLLLFIVLLITGLAAMVFGFLLTMKLSNVGLAILMLILSLVPCVNLIALLVINGIATKRLRNAGIHVGLLGPDMSVF